MFITYIYIYLNTQLYTFWFRSLLSRTAGKGLGCPRLLPWGRVTGTGKAERRQSVFFNWRVLTEARGLVRIFPSFLDGGVQQEGRQADVERVIDRSAAPFITGVGNFCHSISYLQEKYDIAERWNNSETRTLCQIIFGDFFLIDCRYLCSHLYLWWKRRAFGEADYNTLFPSPKTHSDSQWDSSCFIYNFKNAIIYM